MTTRRFKDVLPLQVFIQRSQVIKTYRALLKSSQQCADLSLRSEIANQIKYEFRRNQNITDKTLINTMIKEAKDSITKIEDLCAVSHPSHSKHKDISDRPSWIEEEDDIDKRGRVGEGWPWEQQ